MALTREEVETIAELSVSRFAIQVTREIAGLRADIPRIVSESIGECRRSRDDKLLLQEKRRRWNITAVISIFSILIASVAVLVNFFY